MRAITIITTGGTLEKRYDCRSGALTNDRAVESCHPPLLSPVDDLLKSLWTVGQEILRVPMMNVDSLDMTPGDHQLIAKEAHEHARESDAVIVLHGTDRLPESGEETYRLGIPDAPIVFTGAIRPYDVRGSDAFQNVSNALIVAGLLPPGVYAVLHGRVLSFPGVIKDHEKQTLVSSE